MKKIIATVLAMVMALALCTTAFAATAPYYSDTPATLAKATGCDLEANDYVLEDYIAGAEAAKTFAQKAIYAINKTTKAKTLVDTYVVAVSANSADAAFVNGSTITYLNSVATTYTKNVTAVKTVKVADVANCGEMFMKDDKAVYTDANDNCFYEDSSSTTYYNVGGKMVKLTAVVGTTPVTKANLSTATADNTLYTVAHTYSIDKTTVAGKETATKVTCTVCKASFEFVQGGVADAVAKFGAGNYEVAGTLNNGADTVYVKTGSGTTTPSTDKTTSPKTFDAGIAMYVGMALTSVAGSAVVIGKKKEF